MSRTTIQKLLITSAFVASFSAMSPAHAAATVDVAATGNIAATTGDTPAAADAVNNGTIGARFTAGGNLTGTTTGAIIGGAGGANNGTNGGAGGAGASAFSFNGQDGTSANAPLTLSVGAFAVTGGAGGAGDAATAGGSAHTAGAGGDGARAILADGNFNRIINAGTITGGAGGLGGAGTDSNDNGGAGGAGGAGIRFQGTNGAVLTTTTAIVGGAGAAGGAKQGSGTDGASGAGGRGVHNLTAGGTITINGTGSITGGAGANGTGAATDGAGGTGVLAEANTVITFGAAGSITGGAAGTGGAASLTGSGISTLGTSTLQITGATGTVVSGDSGAGTAIALGGTGNLTNAALVGSAAGTGDAVDLNGTGVTALITNTGTFRTGTGNALDITTGDTLTSLANTGGTIRSDGGNAVRVEGVLTGVTNTGNITGLGANGVAVNVVTGGDLGTITNTSGTITSANTSTTSSGTIVSTTGDGFTLTGGTISNTGAGNVIALTGDQSGNVSSSATLTATNTTNAVRFENAAATFVNTGAITGRLTSSADTKVQTITQTSGGSITGTGTVIDLSQGADTLNLNGGTITGNVDLGADGDTFQYGNATTATGLVGTLGFGAGTNVLDINESFTTGGAVSTTAASATNADVAAGKTFIAAHAVDLADGTLVNNGTVQINSGVTVAADNDTIAGAGKYVIGVSTATTTTAVSTATLGVAGNGFLDLTGNTNALAIAAADDVEVNVAATNTLADNAYIRIGRGGATATNFTGTAVADNSFLYNFLLYRGTNAAILATDETDADLFLLVDRQAATTAAGFTDSAVALNTVLTSLETSSNTQFTQVNDNLADAATAAAYNEVVESITTSIDNSTQIAATSAGLQVVDLAAGRLSGTRSVSSGSETLGNRAWAQGFGTIGKGDAHDGADSFDADTYGAAVGVDGKVLDGNTTLGAAISYGLTNIDSDNANTTETDIDSYQLTLYGDHSFGAGTFVEGVVAYAWNTVESTRHNVGGVAGLTAKGDYDAQTYAAKAAVGHDFGIQDGITITPKAFVEYVSFNADKYTETGAGGANLTVDSDTSDQLNLGTSVELANSYAAADGSLIKPSLNVGYKHDLINDDITTTSTFAAGGASFITKGADQDAGTITAGLGLDYYSTGNYQLTLDYGYENKDSYDGHSGVARASYRF